MQETALNITMPVFNRPDTTRRALLALKKTRSFVPFSVTVVDNGSDAETRDLLLQCKEAGFFDRLFLLPRNMGVSCAANIGWDAVDAPLYMKLDNDMLALDPAWLDRLFTLLRHASQTATFGPAWSREVLRQHQGFLDTPDGELGICSTNLGGACIIIPKTISDCLGKWNEDYGLYGAEDGDYGLRMNCAKFTQYYYYAPDFVENLGKEDGVPTYALRNVDKKEEYFRLFRDKKGGTGFFPLNSYLYRFCIRNWRVPRRYKVISVRSDHTVTLAERPEYKAVREALNYSKRAVDALVRTERLQLLLDPVFIEEMKNVWGAAGQALVENACPAPNSARPS